MYQEDVETQPIEEGSKNQKGDFNHTKYCIDLY